MSTNDFDDTGFAEDPYFLFASFEDCAVRRVLRLMGKANVIDYLRQECQLATGRPELSFSLFHDEYPSWPVRLDATPLLYIHKISLVELLRNFTKTILFRAYMDFAEDYGVDICTESGGLIFRWPGHTMMVLHNHPQPNGPGHHTATISHLFSHSGKQITFTIEPLKSLVDTCLAGGLHANG